MKRAAALIIACLLALIAANAEEGPDGMVFSAYKVCFDESAFSDWQKMMYYENSGLLLSASKGDMEITVSIEEKASAATPDEFLAAYKASVAKYRNVIGEQKLGNWANPTPNHGEGMRIRYRFQQARDTGDVYVTDVYAAKLYNNYYLTCVFNAWGSGRAEADLAQYEAAFFREFSIEKLMVSSSRLAYLKSAGERNGKVYATLDFCEVEYDASIFTIYAVNDNPESIEYAFAADARIWLPVIDEALYSVKEARPQAETLVRSIDEYLRAENIEAIYQVVFNAANEIVWMMHYNAF